MRIKFIRDDIEVAAGVEFDAATMVRRGERCYMLRDVAVDTDRRSAWIHVGNADAVPADAEAQELCQHRMNNWAYKLKAREALAKGIHPEDMERFMSGEISGYNVDGSVIPGPNWQGDDEEDDDDGA